MKSHEKATQYYAQAWDKYHHLPPSDLRALKREVFDLLEDHRSYRDRCLRRATNEKYPESYIVHLQAQLQDRKKKLNTKAKVCAGLLRYWLNHGDHPPEYQEYARELLADRHPERKIQPEIREWLSEMHQMVIEEGIEATKQEHLFIKLAERVAPDGDKQERAETMRRQMQQEFRKHELEWPEETWKDFLEEWYRSIRLSEDSQYTQWAEKHIARLEVLEEA